MPQDRTPTHFRAYNAAGHVVEEGPIAGGKAAVTKADAVRLVILAGGQGEGEFVLFQNGVNGADTYTPVEPPPEPTPEPAPPPTIVSAAGNASGASPPSG